MTSTMYVHQARLRLVVASLLVKDVHWGHLRRVQAGQDANFVI